MQEMQFAPTMSFIKSFQEMKGRVIIIIHIVHLSWKRFLEFFLKLFLTTL